MSAAEGVGMGALLSIREDLNKLMAFASTSIYGVSLLDNPIGFVAAAVIQLVIDWVMQAAGAVGYAIDLAIGEIVLALERAGGSLAEPIVAIGANFKTGLLTINQDLTALVTGLGPAAPIISIVAVGVGVYVITYVTAWVVGWAWDYVSP